MATGGVLVFRNPSRISSLGGSVVVIIIIIIITSAQYCQRQYKIGTSSSCINNNILIINLLFPLQNIQNLKQKAYNLTITLIIFIIIHIKHIIRQRNNHIRKLIFIAMITFQTISTDLEKRRDVNDEV